MTFGTSESAAPAPAPLSLHRDTVRSEWLDDNGHMKVGRWVGAPR